MRIPLANRMVLAVVGLFVPALLSIVALFALPITDNPRHKSAAKTMSSELLLGYGRVDGKTGIRRLLPAVPGRVKVVLAQENRVYEAGEVLLTLEDTAAQLRLRQAQVELHEAKIQLEEARVQSKQLPIRRRRQEERVAAARKTREALRLELDRLRHLVKQKIKEELEMRRAELALEAQNALIRVEEATLEDLRLVNPSLVEDRFQALVDGRQAAVEQAENDLRQYTVVAPEKGMVLRILVGRGDLWPAAAGGQPAIFFCPAGPRIVRAEVAQDWATRLKEGQQVLLQDDENPTMQWQGEIRRIAEWVAPRRSLQLSSLENLDQPTVECIIAPRASEKALLIGQKLRVILPSGVRP
jgi:HlyD family secretion protein